MDPSQDFKAFREAVQSALVKVTRSVNGLANEDLQFQRTVHPSVASQLDHQTDRLLRLASGVLESAGKFTGQRTSRLEDVDDVEIQWRSTVDVIDSLLEKADTCLDEYTGLVKRKDAPTYESGRDAKRPKSGTDRLDWSLKRANILKPQNAFEKKTDNFGPSPWKPLLTSKPHAQIPLEESLDTFTDQEHNLQFKHPYEHEILNMEYPKRVYEPCQPIKYLPMESTKAIWVDTYEGVLDMLEDLKNATEIAIDTEHHDFRSYQGLLSLMQISTREKDWIIDTLVPWRHKLEVLNEVFADPKIVKVLHGAFMDVVWLQRDLGLYVVGLFDTHFASDVLGYAGRSLAFLLKKFVDFDADKKYQLADWRIRPLPEEMFYYARSDTHYLLYIYDMLRNELAEFPSQGHPDGKPIDRVLQRSREVSLQRYEFPLCEPETGSGARGWFNILIKSPTLYNGEQFAVYKAVFKWRDDLARREDESPHFLMAQQVVSDIARIMPVDKKALWSLLDSQARTLKVHLDSLFDVIQEARAKGADGPTMMEFFRQSSGAAAERTLHGDRVAEASVDVGGDPLSIQELKSEHSQLWGNMALSSAWDGSAKTVAPDEQVEIPLFYSDISRNVFSVSESEETKTQSAAEQPAAPEPAAVEEENREFTLKKSGRKRKVSDVENEPEPQSEPQHPGSESDLEMDEEVSSASPDAVADSKKAKKQTRRARREERKNAAAQERQDQAQQGQQKQTRAQTKKERKAAAKAALQQQKRQPAGSDASHDEQHEKGADEEAQQPFDYTKAESVLHASRTAAANGNGRNKNGGKAAFDPYAKKSGDAPQGARKMNYEKAGRTATFKK
ncbi:Exosome complex exonuclease rrp6 [Madurella mycetomatis]|uniref:Exosome complex exonuclease rrp6 n=1 Tax=Madurella mycetomatis TaxID=100816 RepID=A0A175VZ75_9PEZI|nr:Exosome complex exonuclease rrp6 [Madurella mycetomatis]